MVGFQADDVYIGTDEKRRARDMTDDVRVLTIGAGPHTKHPLTDAPYELKHRVVSSNDIKEYIHASLKCSKGCVRSRYLLRNLRRPTFNRFI